MRDIRILNRCPYDPIEGTPIHDPKCGHDHDDSEQPLDRYVGLEKQKSAKTQYRCRNAKLRQDDQIPSFVAVDNDPDDGARQHEGQTRYDKYLPDRRDVVADDQRRPSDADKIGATRQTGKQLHQVEKSYFFVLQRGKSRDRDPDPLMSPPPARAGPT